jgi:hypothetical protein
MRIYPALLIPLLAAALSASPTAVHAQSEARGGNFASTFEMVVDNCKGEGATLDKATVAITQAGPVLTIKIPGFPDLKGEPGKRGKLRAKANGEANDKGIRGKYGFNGRIRSKMLRAVLVAEFFNGDKPLCTQTWSVEGKPRTK